MLAVMLRVGSGCFSTECREDETCLPSTGSGMDAGTDSGPPAGCDPITSADPVADTCGVFVSPTGDDGNAGTKEKPLKTITAALTRSATIYACAGASPFTEAVKIDKAETVTLFGALDCENGWAYDPSKKTQLTAAPDAVPLTIANDRGDVYDFAITSANAMQPGGSSIAVLASGAGATFSRCDLIAGDGQLGDSGKSGGMQALAAEGGTNGDPAGATGPQSGGKGGANTACGLTGGLGGGAGSIPNGPAAPGLPGDGGSGGLNGDGQTATMACTNGANGAPVGDGPLGPGASGIGTIDATGYHGHDGAPGTDGPNGKSGGGGGGSMGGATVHGAGGGGGGAGGWGGVSVDGGFAGVVGGDCRSGSVCSHSGGGVRCPSV